MQCQCYKVDGTQCKYQALKGSKYCGIHKNCKRKTVAEKIDLPLPNVFRQSRKIDLKSGRLLIW